ncbi:MAG TPA: hypothetical protein VD866_17380 [Urbifossiella sp.]|nr:hypothetical protein [Urbifossiella sp.]
MRTVIATLLLAIPLAASPLKVNEAVVAGGTAESDGHGVSGMSLWVRKGEPAVAFGMSLTAGKAGHGFVLVMKGDPDRLAPAPWSGSASSDGKTATCEANVTIGLRADVRYSVTRASESLDLIGRNYDLAKGRVFLIDLTGKEAAVRQVQVELAAPTNPTTAEQVEAISKDHLKRLKAHPRAAAFFK